MFRLSSFVTPLNFRYQCFSTAMLAGETRDEVLRGGKIIMPPSALAQLYQLNVSYPMLFKVTNPQSTRVTHCGVLEFVADEGRAYLPHWMMVNLLLAEGDAVQVECASLPRATFARFQPQSGDFLDITNPKAVLENTLRNFACLTTDDMIAIEYNRKMYELLVLETRPGNAVTIIECDMQVEFAPAPGREQPAAPPERMDMEPEAPDAHGFVPFQGRGHRLDGKPAKETRPPPRRSARGLPDYHFQVGSLAFVRNPKPKDAGANDTQNKFIPFSGAQNSL